MGHLLLRAVGIYLFNKMLPCIDSPAAGNDTLTLYDQKNKQHQKWRIPTTKLTKKIMDFDWLGMNNILAIDNSGIIWNLVASPHAFDLKLSKRGHQAEESIHSCLVVDGTGQRVATSAQGEIKFWVVGKSGKELDSLLRSGSDAEFVLSRVIDSTWLSLAYGEVILSWWVEVVSAGW
jgi:hypothetical protein